MVPAADDDRDDGMREYAAAGFGNGALDEPVSRKAMAVERECGAEIRNDLRLTFGGKQPLFDLHEVSGELIEPMCIVAE